MMKSSVTWKKERKGKKKTEKERRSGDDLS
jgi:hypothetical protein